MMGPQLHRIIWLWHIRCNLHYPDPQVEHELELEHEEDEYLLHNEYLVEFPTFSMPPKDVSTHDQVGDMHLHPSSCLQKPPTTESGRPHA